MISRIPGARVSVDTRCHSWPLFYRLRGMDLLLGGFALSGLLLLLFHRKLGGNPEQWRGLLIFSFATVIVSLNRAAWLLTGRGKVVAGRLSRTLSLLMESGTVDLREFSLRNRIPFSLVRQEVDRIMARRFLLGYLDRRSLEIVINDNPLASGACPACGKPFPAQEPPLHICPACGTVVYT